MSLHMEKTVTTLAAAHGVDLAQAGASIDVDMPNCSQRWLITNIDGGRIGVTRCNVDKENQLSPDLDIIFAISPAGWEPIEIIHTPTVWESYVKAAQAVNQPVSDTQGDFDFVDFTNYMAEALEQQN